MFALVSTLRQSTKSEPLRFVNMARLSKVSVALCWWAVGLAFVVSASAARPVKELAVAVNEGVDLIRVRVGFENETDVLGLTCHALNGDKEELGTALELEENVGYAVIFPVDVLDFVPEEWWCQFFWVRDNEVFDRVDRLIVWKRGDGNVILKADDKGISFFDIETEVYTFATGWRFAEGQVAVE